MEKYRCNISNFHNSNLTALVEFDLDCNLIQNLERIYAREKKVSEVVPESFIQKLQNGKEISELSLNAEYTYGSTKIWLQPMVVLGDQMKEPFHGRKSERPLIQLFFENDIVESDSESTSPGRGTRIGENHFLFAALMSCIAIVFLVVLWAGFYFLVPAFSTVPDCVANEYHMQDKEVTEIRNTLKKLHKKAPVFVPKFSEEMDIGRITKQNMKSVKYKDIKSEIVFEYNCGKDLRDLTEKEAKEILAEAGYTVKRQDVYNTEHLVETICDMSYDYEEKCVTLMVNKAPFEETEKMASNIQGSASQPVVHVSKNGNTSVSLSYYVKNASSSEWRIEPSYKKTGFFDIPTGEVKNEKTDDMVTASFTIIGKEKGNSYVRFYLRNQEQDRRVSYVDCFIIVND